MAFSKCNSAGGFTLCRSRHRCFFAAWLVLLAAGIQAFPAAGEVIDLQQAVTRMLANHPLLEAAGEADLSARSLVDQAGVRPRPRLEIEWENLAGSGGFAGFGGSELTTAVTGTLELGAKRAWRRRVAEAGVALAAGERTILETELTRSLTDVFIEAWVAQERAALAVEKMELADLLLQQLERRAAAGAAAPSEVTRARLGVSQAGIEKSNRDRDYRVAAQRLAGFWGAGSADFTGVMLDPVGRESASPGSAAERREPAPTIALLEAGAAERRLQGDLVLAEARPDLDLAVGVRSDLASGDKGFVLGFGMPLTITGGNEAAARALRHAAGRADLEAEAERARLGSELAALEVQRTATLREIQTLESEVLPLARQSYREVEAGHDRGLFSLTDILETRRTLFELREQHLEALSGLARIQAAARQLAGSTDATAPRPEEEP
ncbi:TolC family protein [bacterium]|nr:TolC family protein [bacterium]